MKKRLFLSFLAFIFAGAVLAVSLLNAHDTSASRLGGNTDHQLYFDKAMLPDHIMYPLFMMVDRVQLETAPKSERIFIEIEYANRRLEYGRELLDSNKEELAVATFTKAEKYLYDATQEIQTHNASDSLKPKLSKVIEYHTRKLHDWKASLTDAHRSVIDRSLEENQILLGLLK